jgi:hypothetical protein
MGFTEAVLAGTAGNIVGSCPARRDPRHTGDDAVAAILMLAVAGVARTTTAYWERERERDLLAVTLPD